MKTVAVTRAVLVVAVGAGLVYGGSKSTQVADATRHTDVRGVVADTTSSRLSDVTLTCTGAETQGSVQVASIPAAWLPKATAGGSVAVQGATSAGLTLQHGGSARTEVPSGVAGVVTGKGSLATGLVATQTQVDSRTTARGLNVSNCGGSIQDGWFFGGGDAAGRVARLTLVNSGATPTTVNASVVGASGTDANASVNGTVVAPGERKVVTFGDFAGSLSQSAVHVTASGAGVVASLTDAWMTGETPYGENTTSDAAQPAKTLVIPGVSATSIGPHVRVAVPGKDSAIVRVRAINATGAIVSDKVQTVPGGSTAGVQLTGLAQGNYLLQVSADVPIVAGTLSRTAGTGVTDLTWAMPAPALNGPAGIAIPSGVPGGAARLTLSAAQQTTVQVATIGGAKAATKTVVVPANQPVPVDVTGASAAWVRPVGGKELHAALTVLGRQGVGGLLASAPLRSLELSQSSVRIVPAR